LFGLYESALGELTWGNLAMIAIAGIIIYLGIGRKMEPLLLVPIGFGIIIANLPMELMMYNDDGTVLTEPTEEHPRLGMLNLLFLYGIKNEIIPLLIFLGVGAMTDFRTAIARPVSFIFGASAQLGVFIVFLIAYLSGWFSAGEAASVAIIGGSDGPPTVILGARLAPHLLGPITLVAFTYMALVPILQPPIIRLLTTKKERATYMRPQVREVSRLEAILFPIMVFAVAALLVPQSIPLVGMFMLGNLLRASGVTDRLADSAGGAMSDILIILLGVCVGALMPAVLFFEVQTLQIVGLAILAFIFSTAGGIWAAQIVNLFRKEKINPLIGAAGVSAVPMAARVAQKEGQKANPKNFLLMHAMGPNVAGAIATSVVAGVFLGILG
jgi:sodium ion-translocating decarboxylase beta subunit